MTFNQFYWLVTIPGVLAIVYFSYKTFGIGFFLMFGVLVFLALFVAVQIEMANRHS